MRNMSALLAVVGVVLFCLPPAALGQNDTRQGVVLSGGYIGISEPLLSEPVIQEEAEDGAWADNLSMLENLPVVESSLIDRALQIDPIEYIRLIIFLDYQPHDAIASQVRGKYIEQIEDLRQEARTIRRRYAAERRLDFQRDSDNYGNPSMRIRDEDKKALRDLNKRNEALALAMHQEIATTLNTEIESYQAHAKAGIRQLGGRVEFGTTAGNAIIALVPAGSVGAVAAIDTVARVVEDRKIEHHLDNAAKATLVTSTRDGGGLWENGKGGGAYTPAVVDSGIVLSHPGLKDSTTPYRENYWSWYLVAGSNDQYWFDSDDIYDYHGHGTHVAGIVGSYGTADFPDHLGMAYGIEKAVYLKAAWFTSTEGAYMYWSDAMRVVDRALNHPEELLSATGAGSFNDDVDGFNLSYGEEVEDDETEFSRFWDSVVSSYPDTVVTIAAGNSGPDNTQFSDPACSYNAITVAAVDDLGTASRTDDTIADYSTRGPTQNGRRKPDIAAPGDRIESCYNYWEEDPPGYVNSSGTSMAAPMILGLAMDLMDAGVFDEKEIKALLINNAQKNEPGIDFESDADGWDPAYGWGYVNAWAAYYHRADVDVYSVTERGTAGDRILLAGQMQDEGAGGEGRDRATMAWNRHVTYNPHEYPTTYHALSDLNLALYRESDNTLLDSDLSSNDNVHQVRIDSGEAATDVVIKAYAWSTDFPHGGTTESFALATEENFSQVDLLSTLTGLGHSNPIEMEPNEIQDFSFSVRNDSIIACHDNQMDLVLPDGWTLVSGSADPYLDDFLDSGETTAIVTWRLQAQATEQDDVVVSFNYSHDSYGENWGPYNWQTLVNVRDTTPPTPDPMTWAVEPHETSTTQIEMTAATATDDLHGPVEYHFQRELTAGSGTTDLGYQSDPTYTDAGLDPNTQYRYWVQARDSATTPNNSSWSAFSDEYTGIESPTGVTFGSVGTDFINARSANTPSGLDRGSSGLSIENLTMGITSGWKQDNSDWPNSGLTPNTSYQFAARARNGDGAETPYSSSYLKYTLAALPGSAAFTDTTRTDIRANWMANGNPDGTEFWCENTTAAEVSGWITTLNWASTGLACGSSYAFHVKARNAEGVETGWLALGSQSTSPCPEVCEGDFEPDGDVDDDDLSIFAADFGRSDCNGPSDCPGEFGSDGDVDAADLTIFAADLGKSNCL